MTRSCNKMKYESDLNKAQSMKNSLIILIKVYFCTFEFSKVSVHVFYLSKQHLTVNNFYIVTILLPS